MKVAQKGLVLEKAMQTKRTEKMLSNLKEQDRRQMEKKDLAAILEILAKGSNTSFP
jgi:hypothetical protein